MDRRALLLRAALLVTAAPVLGACDVIFGGRIYPPFRYRLRVVVETPRGPVIGSSVIEVRMTRGSGQLGSVGTSVRGQAAVIDLPRGEYLFAILRSGYDLDWASGALGMVAPDVPPDPNLRWEENTDASFERMMQMRGPREIPRYVVNAISRQSDGSYPSAYPMLVRFRDRNDPTTVEDVNPDDLAATYGPGYRLRSITVERTDDDVTEGIEEVLPWLPQIRGLNLDGTNLGYPDAPLSGQLGYDDFKTGM